MVRGPRLIGILAAACGLLVACAFGISHFVLPLLQDARALVDAVRSGEAQVDFRSSAPSSHGMQAFQFARLKQIETLRESDTRKVLWNTLELPSVIVVVTVPVEYTYYVDLAKEWKFQLEETGTGDPIVIVEAPPIEFNTPAPNLSELGFEVVKGSILRDEEEVLRNLQSRITGLLEDRAGQNITLVREAGRQKIKEFVAGWLMSRFPGAEDASVEVFFAGELQNNEQ